MSMIQFKRLKLSHANLKRPVFLILGTISGYYWSEANKCTHVFTAGGGVFPAEETPEQISNLVDEITNNANNKETNNGV